MELKQRNFMVMALLEEKRGSIAQPRKNESRDSYFKRRNVAHGGDGGLYESSYRWDRHRMKKPKHKRIFMRRAPRDADGVNGYVGYVGQGMGVNARNPYGN